MKKLLLRYIEGNCNEKEKIEITNWLDAAPEHMKEYLAVRKLHDITIWQTNTEVSQIQQKPKEKNSISLWKPIYSEVLKIAAILILAFIVFRVFTPNSNVTNQVAIQTLHVPAGQRAEITLADGTKVWLNAKSTLTFPTQFTGKKREVKLDGEGFFEVKKDKSNPFIVNTEKYDIKVWGTTFNLMAYSGKGIFETSLLEGSVEILKPGNDKGVIIRPDERIFLKKKHLVIAPIENTDHFLWKEGIISFENESFEELVNKLELYFDLKISVKSDKIMNYRCTGKFRTKDGVEHILKVLQLRNKFSYSIDDKQNIITIE